MTRCGSIGFRPMPANGSSAGWSRRPGWRRPPTPKTPTIAAADAWTAVLDGRTVLDLQEGLQLRRAKVMGEFRVELTGFTDGMVDRLKAMGLDLGDHLLEAAPVRADRREWSRRSSVR